MTSTSLIGREQRHRRRGELLEAPDVRLVTLTGPGGIGKTRLAIAVGEQLDEAPGGPDGLRPARLDQPARPGAAPDRGGGRRHRRGHPVRRSTPSSSTSRTPRRCSSSTTSSRSSASRPSSTSCSPPARRCSILATSRTVLRLRAEREYPVGALTVPMFAERPTLQELASLPAVQLFVDRARAVRYDFALTDDDTHRRRRDLPTPRRPAARHRAGCGPHPAARPRPPCSPASATSSTRWARGPVDLPERQRTLRATVEWSIDLLADAEQADAGDPGGVRRRLDDRRRRARLGPRRGRDARPARRARRPQPRAGRRRRDRAEVPDAGLGAGAGRRAARGRPTRRASSGAHAAVLRATSWRRPTGPAERQVEWAERLRAEEENLRVAIRWFFAHDVTPLPHLFRVLWLFWQMRDRMPEGRGLDRRAPAPGRRAGRRRPRRGAVHRGGHRRRGRRRRRTPWRPSARSSASSSPAATTPTWRAPLQLAISWTLPIVDDFDGALRAATSALDRVPRAGRAVRGLRRADGRDAAR